jgi:hypothetical protein
MGVLRMSESHRRGFGEIRPGRKARATVQHTYGEQGCAIPDCSLSRSVSAANRRSSY